MRYLLVNHVPFGRTEDANAFQVGDMWLEDLRAEAKAIRDLGGDLIVATPLMDHLETTASGSFHTATIQPKQEGFEYVPLPYYRDWRELFVARRSLRLSLERAVCDCTVVQADTGGYPIPLGEIAWPIARALGKRRVWVFDGGDFIGQQQVWASEEPQWGKRLVKKMLVRRRLSFCRSVIREADLVFSHNGSVAEHFRGLWDGHCHQFERSFVREQMLITEAELLERQRAFLNATKPLRLVMASRQIAIKATDQILRAMSIARQRGALLHLDVYGDGEELPKYRLLADELQLSAEVRFHGAVPYGPQLLAGITAADVMVVTNLVPELSRNLLQAMSRGVPLVAYRNPGHDALLERSGAAILVPSGDIGELANAFVGVTQNREQLTGMAARGLDTARSLTLDACHRKRMELVVSMLSRSSRSVA